MWLEGKICRLQKDNVLSEASETLTGVTHAYSPQNKVINKSRNTKTDQLKVKYNPARIHDLTINARSLKYGSVAESVTYGLNHGTNAHGTGFAD